MAVLIRLRHDNTSYLVDTSSKRVYSDQNGDKKIAATEGVIGLAAQRALAAVDAYVAETSRIIPGTRITDGFEVRGALKAAEVKELSDTGSVAAERTGIKLHLDAFDTNDDDTLTQEEAERGFASLGLSPLKGATAVHMFSSSFGGNAVRGALGYAKAFASRVFTKLTSLTSLNAEVSLGKLNRFESTTGIFDANGFVNRARLDEYLHAFGKTGVLSQDALMTFINTKVAAEAGNELGRVSKGQFQSFFDVCRALNGSDTVTRRQFEGLYTGAYLYEALEEMQKRAAP